MISSYIPQLIGEPTGPMQFPEGNKHLFRYSKKSVGGWAPTLTESVKNTNIAAVGVTQGINA